MLFSKLSFDEIADRYEEDSRVQESAAEVLFELADLLGGEDVLDLGCGPGHLSERIAAKTDGLVVGIDPSLSMVKEALSDTGIQTFLRGRAEAIPLNCCFDIVFCNSAFQWFEEPATAVREIYEVLDIGGRVAVQAPARKKYSPTFLKAIDKVKEDPMLRDTFEKFKSPWFFLDTGEAYAELFEEMGFQVKVSEIREFVSNHPPRELFEIFRSGAEAGYLDPANYPGGFDDGYRKKFLKTVSKAFEEMADGDDVELIFNRLLLVADRP